MIIISSVDGIIYKIYRIDLVQIRIEKSDKYKKKKFFGKKSEDRNRS
jgi:hypothetical protein